jgi:tetratricopeptide (TPR) repeat protein
MNAHVSASDRVPDAPAGRWNRLCPWLRDGLLLAALVIPAASLDTAASPESAGDLGTLWCALPLAFLAMALTLLQPDGRPWRWPQAAALLLFGAICAARAWALLRGPLPATGLREAFDLAVALTVAAALWHTAGASPRRALILWTCALALGALVEWSLFLFAEGGSSPVARVVLTSGVVIGAAILSVALWSDRRGVGDLPRAAISLGRVAMLAAGIAAGCRLARIPPDAPQALALELAAGRAVFPDLWLQSLLGGWGRHALPTLTEIAAEPHNAALLAWSGPWMLPATQGLLGIALLGWIALALIGRRGRSARHGQRRTPAGVAAAALLTAGLIAGGGPLSSIAWFALAGWTALAWAPAPGSPPARGRDAESRWSPSAIGATGIVAIALFVLTLALAMPVRGDRLAARGADKQRPLAERERLLSRAEGLNPFNPAIPMRLASVLRERMNTTTPWSESLYLSVIGAYRRAQRLDPTQTSYPLTTAKFQMLCERRDDAFETVEAALDRRPHAAELLDWLYATTLRLDRPREAFQTLERGARMEPMRADWWARQYRLAEARGQSTLAARSLGRALTANPNDPQWVVESWRMSSGARRSVPSIPLTDDRTTSPVKSRSNTDTDESTDPSVAD